MAFINGREWRGWQGRIAQLCSIKLIHTHTYTLSGVLPEFQNLNCKIQRRLSDVLPIFTKVTGRSDSIVFFLVIEGLHGDKLCDFFLGMAPTNVKAIH